MTEHSKLPPSSAARRVICPGSRSLEQRYPKEDSASSREGTAAHWVAHELLVNSTHIEEGSEAPNGEIITEDMIEGAELYLSHVSNIKKIKKQYVEYKIENPKIHEDSWGTPDFFCVTKNKELHVIDYKFGFGFVEVFENWQLIAYTAGILDFIKEDVDKIFLTIIQPRSFHPEGRIRTWETTEDELLKYFGVLSASEKESLKDNSGLYPSSECTYCSARQACTALQNSSLRVIDYLGSNSSYDLNSSQLGVELRYLKNAAKLLDDRITGLEEQTISELKNGKSVPYFSLQQSWSREKWKIPVDEVLKTGEMWGVNLAKPIDTITPKQAVKLGVPEKVVKTFSESLPGAMRLTEDNPRKLFRKNKV